MFHLYQPQKIHSFGRHDRLQTKTVKNGVYDDRTNFASLVVSERIFQLHINATAEQTIENSISYYERKETFKKNEPSQVIVQNVVKKNI